MKIITFTDFVASMSRKKQDEKILVPDEYREMALLYLKRAASRSRVAETDLQKLLVQHPNCELYIVSPGKMSDGRLVWQWCAKYTDAGKTYEINFLMEGKEDKFVLPNRPAYYKHTRSDTMLALVRKIEEDSNNVRLSSELVNVLKTKFKDTPLGKFLNKHGCKVWLNNETYRVVARSGNSYKSTIPAAYDMTFSVAGEFISGNEQEIIDATNRYYDRPRYKLHFDCGKKKLLEQQKTQQVTMCPQKKVNTER